MFGATFWKVVGLALTAALGVIGTVTDTKEKTDAGYRVRPIGWVVVAGIVLALLMAGVGQYYDDRARAAADAATAAHQEAQLKKLSAITSDVQHVRYRLGALNVVSVLAMSAKDPTLRRLRSVHPAFLNMAYRGPNMSETDQLAASQELVRGFSVLVLVRAPVKDDMALLWERTGKPLVISDDCPTTQQNCAMVSQVMGTEDVEVTISTTVPRFNRATLDSLVAFGGRETRAWVIMNPEDGPDRVVSLQQIVFHDVTNHRYVTVDRWAHYKAPKNNIFADAIIPLDVSPLDVPGNHE